jgi:hypothetical protein
MSVGRESIVEDEVTIVGMFSQNGFQTIKIGTAVYIVSTTPRATFT